jgi:hypothetical protein
MRKQNVGKFFRESAEKNFSSSRPSFPTFPSLSSCCVKPRLTFPHLARNISRPRKIPSVFEY